MNLKKRIAVCLCLLLVMPALLESLPALTLQANAAGETYVGASLPWDSYIRDNDTNGASNSLILEVGQEVDFSPYFYYYNTSDYVTHYLDTVTGESYKSSNTSVVSVTKSGVVNAKKKGTAKITLKYKGHTIKANIKVVSKKYTKGKEVKELNSAMTSLWNSYGNKEITTKNVVSIYNKVCDLRSKAMKCNAVLGLENYSYPAVFEPFVYLSADNSYRVLFNYGNYSKINRRLTAFALNKNNSIVATVSTKNLTAKTIKTSNKTITVNLNKAVTKQHIASVNLFFGKFDNKISASTSLKLNYGIYQGKNLKFYNYFSDKKPVAEGTITLKPGTKKLTIKLKKKLAKGDYFIGFYPKDYGVNYSLSISKAFTVK